MFVTLLSGARTGTAFALVNTGGTDASFLIALGILNLTARAGSGGGLFWEALSLASKTTTLLSAAYLGDLPL